MPEETAPQTMTGLQQPGKLIEEESLAGDTPEHDLSSNVLLEGDTLCYLIVTRNGLFPAKRMLFPPFPGRLHSPPQYRHRLCQNFQYTMGRRCPLSCPQIQAACIFYGQDRRL